MTEVYANARARVFRFDESDDDVLAPLPPPPRPQARPSMRGTPTARPQRASTRRRLGAGGALTPDDDDDVGTPQTPPVPHEHPLAAISSSNSNGADTRRSGASHRAAHHLRGKRLDPAFFNPKRIGAFLNKTREAGNDDVALAAQADTALDSSDDSNTHTLHSTRMLERRIRAVENAPVALPELLEDERVRAATDASHWRHELHPLPVHTVLAPSTLSSSSSTLPPQWHEDSALERARVRKVAKQVDTKWLQTQHDAANRPRAPLERDDEHHLREKLMQTRASELLASGVLFDSSDDATRLTTFTAVAPHARPLSRSGTTGLPGCCFDSWSF